MSMVVEQLVAQHMEVIESQINAHQAKMNKQNQQIREKLCSLSSQVETKFADFRAEVKDKFNDFEIKIRKEISVVQSTSNQLDMRCGKLEDVQSKHRTSILNTKQLVSDLCDKTDRTFSRVIEGMGIIDKSLILLLGNYREVREMKNTFQADIV